MRSSHQLIASIATATMILVPAWASMGYAPILPLPIGRVAGGDPFGSQRSMVRSGYLGARPGARQPGSRVDPKPVIESCTTSNPARRFAELTSPAR